MTADEKFNVKAAIQSGLKKALEAQYPLAVDTVARLRRVYPDKTPAELVSYLNKIYLGAVTTTGAGAGAAAIIPNGIVQIPVAAADLLSFLEASILYSMSVAEVTGINPEDVERRRTLVLGILVGNSALSSTLEALLGKSVPYWGKKIVAAIPMSAINQANAILGPRFITKYGVKQGVLVLGKQIPFAIGVGVGAAGNHLFGWAIIKSAKKLLGPPPELWSDRAEMRTP